MEEFWVKRMKRVLMLNIKKGAGETCIEFGIKVEIVTYECWENFFYFFD